MEVLNDHHLRFIHLPLQTFRYHVRDSVVMPDLAQRRQSKRQDHDQTQGRGHEPFACVGQPLAGAEDVAPPVFAAPVAVECIVVVVAIVVVVPPGVPLTRRFGLGAVSVAVMWDAQDAQDAEGGGEAEVGRL